mgnify:CR=1 FL=1
MNNNRKKSILVATFFTMILFGVTHLSSFFASEYNLVTLVYSILFKGLGSIFEIYSYVKTKNIFISYLIHLVHDFICVFFPLIKII